MVKKRKVESRRKKHKTWKNLKHGALKAARRNNVLFLLWHPPTKHQRHKYNVAGLYPNNPAPRLPLCCYNWGEFILLVDILTTSIHIVSSNNVFLRMERGASNARVSSFMCPEESRVFFDKVYGLKNTDWSRRAECFLVIYQTRFNRCSLMGKELIIGTITSGGGWR